MPRTVAEVLEHLSNLPPFPKVTAKLLSLLNNPHVSVDELAGVISADPSLVMKVIKISNSPFYMVSRPIENVKDAVFILGLNTIKSVTTAISIQNGLNSFKPREDIFSLPEFWKHSYAMAITANKLAKARNIPNHDKFYLAGLIHDIGKMIIAFHWPESWKRIVNYLKVGTENYAEVEARVFNHKHTEIAVTLCRNWQFPDDIIKLLEDEAREDKEMYQIGPEGEILPLTCHIVKYCDFAFPREDKGTGVMTDELSQYASIMTGLPAEVEYQLAILDK